ncbi:hypothetical protein JCM5296_007610 [Sporobolomyces johnsonii]
MQRNELAHALATAVTRTYSSLPPNGKPSPRSNGLPQSTVLAGVCVYRDPHHVVCVSLGTGLKALPHANLPVHGDVLHDSHAEIITKRGFRLWIYAQIDRALSGDDEAYLVRAEDGWSIRTGWEVGLWVSTLPCQFYPTWPLDRARIDDCDTPEAGGDASTYALSLASPSSSSSTPDLVLPSPSLHPSLVQAASLGLITSRSPSPSPSPTPTPTPAAAAAALARVHRGRTSYTSLNTLRTKPGRADSRPTTAHACSDKLALWALVGLQGALLSTLRVEPVRLACVAVGGIKGDEAYRERVAREVTRAVGGRLEGWEGPAGERVAVPRVELVEEGGVEFEHSREVVARVCGVDEDEVLSCQESLSWVEGLGTEVITNGIRQGASSKRKPGEPLGPKARSRLSKLSLFQRHLELEQRILSSSPSSSSSSTGPSSSTGLREATTYFSTKHDAASSSARAYQDLKAAVRATTEEAAGPFAGWLVSGEEWESFDAHGRVSVGGRCGGGR